MQGSETGKEPPDGWMSASKLADSEFGRAAKVTNAYLYRKMEDLHAAIIEDMKAAGYGQTEAVALVEDHLIGFKETPKSHGPRLYISPDAVDLLDIPPLAPRRWSSPSMLEKGGGAERSTLLRRQMEELRVVLIEDMKVTGYSDTEATNLIDDHLIGHKRPSEGMGRAAIYASPEALRLLGKEGLPSDNNGVRSDKLAAAYLRLTEKLERNGDLESAIKFYKLIESEFIGTKESKNANIKIFKMNGDLERNPPSHDR
jgi:hypothetical protein